MAADARRETGVGAWAVIGPFMLEAVFALREARALLAPVFIAIVLTFVLTSVLASCVRWLRRRGVPKMLGAFMLVAAPLASTLPLAASLARPLTL